MESDLAARILYRDADAIVLDKPAGVAVHEAPGTVRILDLDSLKFGLKRAPGLAHRLDRDTSGCLVLGRHPAALRALNRLFAEGRVEKTYWTVVEGEPAGDEGVIDLPLLKVRRGGAWSIVVERMGQPALTEWRVLGRADGRSWLELKPRTGRTHQLRVHCAAIGYPVVGDPVHGRTGGPGERLHLHARAVRFPWRRGDIDAMAAPPPHMRPALESCGFMA